MLLFWVGDDRTTNPPQPVLVCSFLCLLLVALSQPPLYHSTLGRVLQGSHWRGQAVEIGVHNHVALWMTRIWSVEQASFELYTWWTSCELNLSRAVPVASCRKCSVPINKWSYTIPELTTCMEQLHTHVVYTYFIYYVVTFPDSSPVVFFFLKSTRHWQLFWILRPAA